jgi:hypothetical protein
MARSTGSDWMRSMRLHERTREEGMAVARARRQYEEKCRLGNGLSDPAAEQMRGYADPPAGKNGGVDIGGSG